MTQENFDSDEHKTTIGRVVFAVSGSRREAVLTGRGIWTCVGDSDVEDSLNRDFRPIDDAALRTASGREMLIKAARRLEGLAWFGPGKGTL